MEITVTTNMLPDLLAASSLLTLAIYHLMIYWGRRKDADEIYNLYFALFTFSVALLLVATYFQSRYFLFRYKPSFINVINIEMFSVWLLFYSGIHFLNHLLKTPAKFKKYFYVFFSVITLNFLATLSSNFINIWFYYKYVLGPVLFTIALCTILLYILYGRWIYKEGLYKNTFIKTIFFGFVIITLNIFIYRAIEVVNATIVLVPNHYVTAVMLYIFAYALSVKFNKEHQELKELKIGLENKVEERTNELKTANQVLESKNIEIEKQKQEIIFINKELLQRAEELKELDIIKSRFFTNISHEFRTPLTLIIGPLESLIEKASSEEQLADYELMLKHARRLLSLINQLLELSKLQKNMIKLQLSEDNIHSFVRTQVNAFSSLGKELHVNLNFTAEEPEKKIWFDKDKLEKIVVNLVSNAFKFTPNGGTIDVVLKDSANHDYIEIAITDNGIGIEKEELTYIFDPFYQVDASYGQKFKGTGIGLALVKELINLHHGYVHVSSEVLKGTQFIIGIPLLKTAYKETDFLNKMEENQISQEFIPIEKIDDEVSKELVSKDKTLILLVDDNTDMRNFIAKNLKEYHTIQASNGSEGFELAIKNIPDLIVADIMMPIMNGIELTRKLKNTELTSHIPVILLTAKASVSSKIEGFETEADDYMVKPFNMVELKTRIRNLLLIRQKLREKYNKKFIVNPSNVNVDSMDERFMQKALEVVEKNIGEPDFNISIFSNELNMSRTQVYRKLTALTGQSATEFIRTIRLKRAAQMLQKNSGSISEIAFANGFNNMSYFTKAFKEVFGLSPSEYKERM